MRRNMSEIVFLTVLTALWTKFDTVLPIVKEQEVDARCAKKTMREMEEKKETEIW